MTVPHCLVSIVIPTFNRAVFLPDAINSCLSQELEPLETEIIVVDDGSTDSTSAVLNAFEGRIRYIALETNQGRNRARNTGLKSATGRFVKFLDSDDVLEKNSLKIEIATAIENDADIVVSGWQSFEQQSGAPPRFFNRCNPPAFDGSYIDGLLAGEAVPTSAALYSRTLITDLVWDESLRKLDDWDWFIRAALRAKKIVPTSNVAYSWRQHPDQGIQSESMLKNAMEHYLILRKLEDTLEDKEELSLRRKQRLAQYFYKEVRVFCLHDKNTFNKVVDHIYELDPHFKPYDEERQAWMRWLCRVVGVRAGVSFHSFVKKSLSRTQQI